MYKKLKEAIENIKIIDNHGHPGIMEYFEQFPPENRIPIFADPFRTPEEIAGGLSYIRDLHYEAYEKLYGFTKKDLQDPNKKPELAAQYEKKRKDLRNFADQIMELAGVELYLVNFAMPESLKGNSKFKFVAGIDHLCFPFDNQHIKNRIFGKFFLNHYEYLLNSLKQKYNYTEKGYSGYLEFIDKVMDDIVKDGCVGFKNASSYVRNMYFEKIDEKDGPYLYEKAKGGDKEAYQKLQDLLVWYTMKKAVQYDLPVQFHCAIIDNFVDYFDPMNLLNFVKDPETEKAKIVILHGGYPNFDHAEAMALGGIFPNNVYIDISGRIMFANHPKIIAEMLRKWLEKPSLWGKILYGSDVLLGERYIYTCARTGRNAVYIALAGMIDDDIIDENTAIKIATMILRDNSKNLYKLVNFVS